MKALVSKRVTVSKIDNAETGKRIRAMRITAGVTAKKLAQVLNITAGYLCDLEHGRRNWTPELVKRIEEALT